MRFLMQLRLPPLPAPLKPVATAFLRLFRHDGHEIGGFIAYTVLVAIFPFTIFLFALAGFLHQGDMAQSALDQALALMPYEVRRTLQPLLKEILGQEQPGLMTVGVLGTLWATSAGVDALRLGLNRAYEATENRAFWKRKLSGFAFVVGGALVLVTVGTLVVLVPLALAWVEARVTLPDMFVWVVDLVRYVVAGLLLVSLMATCYRYLPNTPQRWREVWTGSVLAAALWMILASLFSLYLSHSGDYTVTYGSLGGIVITLLFLQFSAMMFLLGAEFNAVLELEAGVPEKEEAR